MTIEVLIRCITQGGAHCTVSPELQISRTALAARSLQGPPCRALSPNGAQVCGTKLPLSGEEFYQFFIILHHFFIDITVCSSSAVRSKVIREWYRWLLVALCEYKARQCSSFCSNSSLILPCADLDSGLLTQMLYGLAFHHQVKSSTSSLSLRITSSLI